VIGVLLPSGLRRVAALAHLPDDRAGVVDGPDLGPWLKRRKDAKMLPRAAQLALPAAGVALGAWGGDREELGLFVAVGREPPDEGDAEPALARMHDAGRLSRERLAAGRDAYPPLLPLRTLPNMVLAHVAINLGIRGENAVYAGGAEAGRCAWREGVRAVREGRVPAALVGAAYSAVDLASARDRLRLGLSGPPGEGAVFALLVPGALDPAPSAVAFDAAKTGDLGPVAGLLALLAPQADRLATDG
jgi:hypothetical protein